MMLLIIDYLFWGDSKRNTPVNVANASSNSILFILFIFIFFAVMY